MTAVVETRAGATQSRQLDRALEDWIRQTLTKEERGALVLPRKMTKTSRVEFGPWRTRHWSFVRPARIVFAENAGEHPTFRLWLKMPKQDAACRDPFAALRSAESRLAGEEEARSHAELTELFRAAKPLATNVAFVPYLGWHRDLNVIVTQHVELPEVTQSMRRARSWEGPVAEGVLRRAGSFLGFVHGATQMAPSPAERAQAFEGTKRRFRELLLPDSLALRNGSLFRELRRMSAGVEDLLRRGYEDHVPFVLCHRGTDVRNLLDDGVSQVVLDPEASFHDVAYRDLAKFLTTLSILDYGSLQGLRPVGFPPSWAATYLASSRSVSAVNHEVLAAFRLLCLLDRFEDSRRLLQAKRGGKVMRGVLGPVYTLRFFSHLIRKSLASLETP